MPLLNDITSFFAIFTFDRLAARTPDSYNLVHLHSRYTNNAKQLIRLKKIKSVKLYIISEADLTITECLLAYKVTAKWWEVAVNPVWSTVVAHVPRRVASDMTPVWKSAFQVPARVSHTIFDTMKRVHFVASHVHRYSCYEIDDGSE